VSITIFYKGRLKENISVDMFSSTIEKYVSKIDCNVYQDNGAITIIFKNSHSEPLVFDFNNDAIDDFFKWNGKNMNEFYEIFDLFKNIKPLFRSLKITDDEGLWEEYISQSQPCKVLLRSLVGEKENCLLKRAIKNKNIPLSKTEHTVIVALRLNPSALSLYRLIVQDFIKILNLKCPSDFNPKSIVAFANELTFADDYIGEAQERIFECQFPYIIIQTWISHAFSYGKYGIVSQLSNNIRGLKSSKLAALFGILSIFLNCHGGIVNKKHAEMKKMVALNYTAGYFGEFILWGCEKTELEFFVSMMDYLKFTYVGVE